MFQLTVKKAGRRGCRGGQRVRGLLLRVQHPHKKPAVTPVLWGWGQEDFWSHQPSSRFRETPCLEKIRQSDGAGHLVSSSGLEERCMCSSPHLPPSLSLSLSHRQVVIKLNKQQIRRKARIPNDRFWKSVGRKVESLNILCVFDT